MWNHNYWTYIMTNEHNKVLYTGVTGNIIKRVHEHRHKMIEGFTKQYNCTKLVYYERYTYIHEAIHREKQIKAGSRQKKMDLVNAMNPGWRDLFDEL